jgi:hypothetical protein
VETVLDGEVKLWAWRHVSSPEAPIAAIGCNAAAEHAGDDHGWCFAR